MATIAELSVNLKAETGNLRSRMKQAGSDVSSFGTHLNNAGKDGEAFGKSMELASAGVGFLGTATSGAITGLLGMLGPIGALVAGAAALANALGALDAPIKALKETDWASMLPGSKLLFGEGSFDSLGDAMKAGSAAHVHFMSTYRKMAQETRGKVLMHGASDTEAAIEKMRKELNPKNLFDPEAWEQLVKVGWASAFTANFKTATDKIAADMRMLAKLEEEAEVEKTMDAYRKQDMKDEFDMATREEAQNRARRDRLENDLFSDFMHLGYSSPKKGSSSTSPARNPSALLFGTVAAFLKESNRDSKNPLIPLAKEANVIARQQLTATNKRPRPVNF